jgi:sigma-E factor negative regulatory protein RseC
LIESPARIRRTEGDIAWVVSEAPASCGACAGKGCGSSIFARIWHPDAAEFPVANPIGASVGEAVVIGLPDGALLHAALASYGLALALLLAFAGLGAYFSGEPGAIIGGLSGLALTAIWLRLRVGLHPNSNPSSKDDPVILRRGTASSCQKS